MKVHPLEAPGSDEVRIGPLRRRHLRQVMRIEHQVYPRPWTAGIFVSELGRRTDRCYLVARAGALVVGYGGQLYSDVDAHITNIAVDPAWQRKGVGTRMLLELARHAIDTGCRNLTLEVRVSNTAAQEMYRRFGFAPAGIRTKYYENTEDAIVMWATDIDRSEYRDRLASIESRLQEAQ